MQNHDFLLLVLLIILRAQEAKHRFHIFARLSTTYFPAQFSLTPSAWWIGLTHVTTNRYIVVAIVVITLRLGPQKPLTSTASVQKSLTPTASFVCSSTSSTSSWYIVAKGIGLIRRRIFSLFHQCGSCCLFSPC